MLPNVRKFFNELFKAEPPEEIPTSPTYAPYLAERINIIGTTLEELRPDRDYTRIKALKTAYSTKHPTPAQLKTMHNGAKIMASLPTDILAQHDWQDKIALEDDLAKISDMAELAGDYMETEHGRARSSSIELAKRLAGHPLANEQENPTYVDKLDALSAELKNYAHIYPARTRKKIEQSAKAICDMAEGHTPEYDGLTALTILEGCIHAINQLVKSMRQLEAYKRQILYPKLDSFEQAAAALLEHNNNYDNGPMGLIRTVENLIIHDDKHGTALKYDLEAKTTPEETTTLLENN